MPRRQKDLSKHRVKYFLEEFEPLLEKNGEKELLEKAQLNIWEDVLRLNCFDDDTYQRLSKYEEQIPEGLASKLKLERVVFRYDSRYSILRTVDEFRSQGIEEFTFAQLQPEAEKLAKELTVHILRSVLLEMSLDVSKDPWAMKGWPKWFIEFRKLYPYPMVEKIKAFHFKILEKRLFVPPQEEPKKKSTKKSRSNN